MFRVGENVFRLKGVRMSVSVCELATQICNFNIFILHFGDVKYLTLWVGKSGLRKLRVGKNYVIIFF